MSLSALSVVVNHNVSDELERLREENTKIMKSIKITVDDLDKRREYYDNLVALARTEPDNTRRHTKIKEGLGSDNYDKELKRLLGDEGDWYHGFNSGMLAATRLYGSLTDFQADVFENEEGNNELYPVEQKWEDAKQEFPFLDT